MLRLRCVKRSKGNKNKHSKLITKHNYVFEGARTVISVLDNIGWSVKLNYVTSQLFISLDHLSNIPPLFNDHISGSYHVITCPSWVFSKMLMSAIPITLSLVPQGYSRR